MLTSRNKQATGDTDTLCCNSRPSRPVGMQWETKGQFSGQVKPVGIEKSMDWKMGFVHFDHDEASGVWMARLYFKVNPNRVCQQMKIGRADNLDVKCGRLMIENKKGDGIHIKLSSADVTHAKLLVSKIKNSMATTTSSSNKAEVGFSSDTTLSSHKGSENISPYSGEDSFDLSLFQASNHMSPEQRSLRRLYKNSTPSRTGAEHNIAPKRKLELFSVENQHVSGRGKDLSTPHRFTGMKDYSKRNPHEGNSLSVRNVIGPKSFYSTQKLITTNNVYRNSQVNSYHHGPALKRPKLSSLTVASTRMFSSRDRESSSAPALGEASGISRTKNSSLSVPDNPKHCVKDGETIGFQNLGNTCFLNAPLQCLSALEPLTLDIQSAVAQYGRELKSDTVTRKLYQLMKDVRRYDVCPEHITELLATLRGGMNVKFAPDTQQDAHELLSELLNHMDEEVKAAMRLHASSRWPLSIHTAADKDAHSADMLLSSLKQPGSEASPVMDSSTQGPTPTESNFCWSYRTYIYFHQCKTEVTTSHTEREMTLMLALDPTTKNLQDCIHKYFESTDVEMKCEKCGKNEKATITRKIVRRPRVFILNLLRYYSDNVESTKKADLVHVPSYISICDYCADDVVKPTHIDAVLLLDRLSQSNAQNALAKVLNTSGTGQQIQGPSPPGADIWRYQDKRKIFDELVAVLADMVSCNLRSVSTYIEDIHNSGQDVTKLYMKAENTICKLRTNIATALKSKNLPPDIHIANTFGSREMLLSEILLKKVLPLDERELDSLPEDALYLVIKELMVTHFDDTDDTDNSDKCMNHLIDDLGLYVVVAESGAIDADNPDQRSLLTRFHGTLKKFLSARSSVATERGFPDGEDSDVDVGSEVEIEVDGSHVKVEDDVYFKRTETSNAPESSSDVKTNQDVSSHQTEKKYEENLSDEWNYANWGDDLEEKQQRQPLSDITVQTSYRSVSPDSSSDMLQGKHISSYTEADLLNIDTASLTDDETIVFVKALSQFEYEKEQASMSGTDSCDSLEIAADADEQAGADSTHLQAFSGNSASLKQSATPGVGSSTAEVQGTSNECLPCTRAEILASRPDTSAGNISVDLEPLHKSDFETFKECSMLCHEEIVDFESPGNVCDYSNKTITVQSTSDQDESLMGTDTDISIKHCITCGKLSLTGCTGCGSLGQTDFDSHPLDTSLCTVPAETVSCLMSTDTEEPSLILCEKASGKDGNLSHVADIVDGVRLTEAQPSVQVAAGQSQADTTVGEQGSQASMAASKKEFLFSPPKTNNLTRTRDYARLKSPASSPKKRTAKGPSPKSDCVTKRQHYSEKGCKPEQATADRAGDASVDSGSPGLQDISMEVNVDDLSFFEHHQAVDTAVLDLSHQSTPCSAGSRARSRQNQPSQTSVDCGKPKPIPVSTAGLEVSNLSSQVSHFSGVHVEAQDSSPHTSRNWKVTTTEGLQENIQPEVSATHRRKVVRSSTTYIPDIEEKENMHQDRSKSDQLAAMEDKAQDLCYKLVSVVDHTGSSQFTGHYTAYAFNISRQTWFHLNDTETRMVTEDTVREVNTQTGYLFFYMDK